MYVHTQYRLRVNEIFLKMYCVVFYTCWHDFHRKEAVKDNFCPLTPLDFRGDNPDFSTAVLIFLKKIVWCPDFFLNFLYGIFDVLIISQNFVWCPDF